MLKQKMTEEERQNGLLMLRHFIRKLQAFSLKHGDELKRQTKVPEDVKEGHFAVYAVKTEKPQRFVVELQFLTNPAFLRLLKRAEEEYGFKQKGVLAVPCRPEELQKILHLQVKVGENSPAGEYNANNH